MKAREIIIYSPVDGSIYFPFENDGIKLGFLLKTQDVVFFSPFKKSRIFLCFPHLNRYVFEKNLGLFCIMDIKTTVKKRGKSWVEFDQEVDLDSKICSWNLRIGSLVSIWFFRLLLSRWKFWILKKKVSGSRVRRGEKIAILREEIILSLPKSENV